MSMSSRKKTIAFAKFREKQRDKSPITIDFFDEDSVEIPAEMPAAMMLDLMDYYEEHGEDADTSDIPMTTAIRMLSTVLGDGELRELLAKHNATSTEMFELFSEIVDAYHGDIEQTESLGKTPVASDSTSSKNGT